MSPGTIAATAIITFGVTVNTAIVAATVLVCRRHLLLAASPKPAAQPKPDPDAARRQFTRAEPIGGRI